ncbi:hypothetical protein KP509_08G048700 [Ceratopteris richardii]|uniref:FAD-binding FR-type domain-containing protein n=1 Tax=Ceratopteris richardii TaxID=49495 RepID=A0A8T2UAA9_CERRI|nr:hypothetical protein KP509_08G048700 [Ceratopteris richardii]
MALQSSSSLHPTTNKFHVCLPAMAGVATRVAQLVNLKHPSTLRIRQRHSLQQAFQAHSRRSLSLPPKDARAGVAFALDISFVEAPLVKKELAAEQIYSLVLDISSNPSLMKGHTAAGQYVQLRVPGTDAKPAYISIASPPRTATSGSLEFLIKYVEGSTAGYLCNLKKGDKVEVSPVGGSGFPIDRLYPAEDFPTVLIFATGTGISPVRSLIEAGFDAIKRSDVRLYYGTRSLRWMAYQEKFKEWEASGIRVIPVLSQSDGDWEGEAGYVQAAFQKEKGITDPLRTGAILAGQREMMEDVTSHLLAEGVLKEKIIKNF